MGSDSVDQSLERTVPSVDDVFGVLASERRRLVLRYLRDRDRDRARIPELVDHVATGDDGAGERSRVEIALHHVDLPKLEAAGLLERDRERNAVRYRGHPLVEASLDAVGEPRERI